MHKRWSIMIFILPLTTAVGSLSTSISSTSSVLWPWAHLQVTNVTERKISFENELPKLQDISDTNQSSSDNNSLGNSFQLVMGNMLILWEAQLKHCWAESSIRLLSFTSDNNWCHKNCNYWLKKLLSQDWQCTASPLLVKIYLLSHSTDTSNRALFFNVQQNNANRTEIQMYIFFLI